MNTLSISEAAAALGISETQAYSLASRGFLTVAGRRPLMIDASSVEARLRNLGPVNRGDYLPSPEEIAVECADIRGGWSEAEHWRRAGFERGRPHRVETRPCRVAVEIC